MTTSNRINSLFDNDFARVVERARKSNVKPAYWQVIDVNDNWRIIYIDEEELLEYETDKSKTYLFSPMFDRTQSNINGVAVRQRR